MSGTTYTPSLRFAIMTPGDPAVRDQWGQIRDTTVTLYEQAIVGNSPISIDGMTSYTLTANNNASDQARQALYSFAGALTGNCTVTIPPVPRIGWAANYTTGGYNVVLTTGSGITATLAPGLTYFFDCDGINVSPASLGLAPLAPTAAASWVLHFPGGITKQGGSGSLDDVAINFQYQFSGVPWTINLTLVNDQPAISIAVAPGSESATNFVPIIFSSGVGINSPFYWEATGPT